MYKFLLLEIQSSMHVDSIRMEIEIELAALNKEKGPLNLPRVNS